LESGIKWTFRFIDNSYTGERIVNTLLTADSNNNNIRYNDQIYAAYGMISGTVKKLNIKAGLRTEQSYRSFIVLNKAEPYTDRYLNLFPSLFVTQKLNKKINAFVSYSKRINRPSVQTLNPFPDNNDPNNQILGNPYILPEIIHSVESGGQWSGTASSASVTFYIRETVNKIQRIRETVGLISTIKFLNLNNAINAGAEMMWRNDWKKWFNTTLSANVYSIYLNSNNINGTINDRSWTYTGKLLTLIKPVKGIDIQINSNYNAPFITPQGKIKAVYYTDISVKKDIFKKSGSLTVGVTDIFDTRQFAIDTFFENITQDVIRKRESRIFTLGFNYRFGKNESAQQRKRNITDDFGGGEQ
jgi:outer membrane receptor protein involved in Fe transport